MKYFCMGYHDEQAFAVLTDQERQKIVAESLAYERQLRREGLCIDSIPLQPVQTAATLRFEGGTMSVTDGPFAETKEHLGGGMILNARDLNHAIQLMSKVPCMRLGGSIEIRPINEAFEFDPVSATHAMAGV